MEDYEVTINKIAQGIISSDYVNPWYLGLAENQQYEVLRTLNICIFQSHPAQEEIENGIKVSGLKDTYTPCVIMLKNNFRNARQKVLALPANEWHKSFRLWLAIFTLADTRRRETDCKNGCGHWWHNLDKV
jgi:hypothetical protein